MTTNTNAPAAREAPWRSLFLEHISAMPSPIFALGTVRHGGAAPSPRVRTCVFRGMWASLPPNDKNTAPRNPAAFESDCPTFTTDARMAKVDELAGGPSAPAPVEAVFWPEEKMTQWRLRGRAVVLGPDADADAHGHGLGIGAGRAVVAARMRLTGDAEARARDAGRDWGWAREVTAHFGNLSPLMRGSFRNPPCGVPKDGRPARDGEGLGQRVEGNDDELARRNFRVVVIVPDEVDQVDLSDAENPKRWLYSLQESGEWNKVETWP